jgi:hypothetical protein
MAGNKIKGASPPTSGPSFEVVRVKTSEVESFTIVCRAVWGQSVHWFGGRSHECTQETGNCARCNTMQPLKWKGYLQALSWQTRKQVFVEITPNAYEQLVALTEARETLRGTVVKIRKTKGGAKGRYIVDVLERTIPEAELPEERDPLPVLRFLWRANGARVNPPA